MSQKSPKGGHPNSRATNGRIKKEENNSSDSENEEKTYMSLDVLAQVASATLQKEPKFSPSKRVPVSKRNLQSLDLLNLDQIQTLSDKVLINLFADLVCNEMTRNYTYTCCLMPKKCKDSFSSFGNESKARLKIRTHLLSHIEQLIDDANDPGRTEPFSFTAVPVRVQKKKALDSSIKKRRGGANLSNPSTKKNVNPVARFTGLKPCKRLGLKPVLASKDHSEQNTFVSYEEVKENSLKRRKNSQFDSPNKQTMAKRYAHKKSILSDVHTADSGSKSKHLTHRKRIRNGDTASSDISLPGVTERRIEENEQFIIELLNRTQPHHDHCYTTIFGKKRGIENISMDSDSSSDDDDDSSIIDVGGNVSYIDPIRTGKPPKPILLYSVAPPPNAQTPMVSAEEIINPNEYSSESEEEGHTGERPYPPMPKSQVAKTGRISIPEESASFSEGEEDVSPRKRKKQLPVPDISNLSTEMAIVECERKIALKCIRELKGRKKDDKLPLMCKICLGKTFTASATLMYHYRSHAGIKPFVCLICNTTFTRQHSLNYHMLIHNNQSRFTCKDCGRKFRHPSHFKEHLRRHTGETPFECMDCPLKFKTRNTYKRHLKTRHGKLLTANGIQMMSKEEFQKVRTKPYKMRSPTDPGNNEDDDDDDDDIEDDDEEMCSAASKTESESSLSMGMHNYIAQSNSTTAYVTTPVTQQGSLYVPIGIVVNT
ncbi:zinc finger and BTB domain-containing protein 18-like [Gigantopelta aegis]|uniref:zinc finger and BTB domain-containing protein 18-like n=1 Tax=Gigantopelta aegis TaxID=1735272 RepID=UPI001B88E070|nr:zinc finger and BTB domain-containing protein 18-like [Gigantopelta aegis]